FFASFLEVLFTSFLAVEMFCKIQQLHLTMIFSIAKIIHLGILRIIIKNKTNISLLRHNNNRKPKQKAVLKQDISIIHIPKRLL
ncbi:MAG: hypothetical protein J5965_07545, partial [Aeriscardovia sp.]|nr:hypothetical protein [Aeriscardovia sp.]